MTTPSYIDHVLYILECIERLEEIAQSGEAAFQQLDYWVYEGVLRQLHTLAESAHKLPDHIKQQHTHIRWRAIADFRNILVHNYLGEIDRSVIWQVLVNELPELYTVIQQYAPS